MSNGKAERPDQISMEVWKRLGEKGLKWLTVLSNVILGLLRDAQRLEVY